MIVIYAEKASLAKTMATDAQKHPRRIEPVKEKAPAFQQVLFPVRVTGVEPAAS